MYTIEVRESGEGLLVELWGEWDIYNLGDLERMLTDVSSHRGWSLGRLHRRPPDCVAARVAQARDSAICPTSA